MADQLRCMVSNSDSQNSRTWPTGAQSRIRSVFEQRCDGFRQESVETSRGGQRPSELASAPEIVSDVIGTTCSQSRSSDEQ